MTQSEVFDESLDAVDRAGKFLSELSFLLFKHRVKVIGSWRDLQQCHLSHEDAENGYEVDMQDIQTLTDGKTR